MSSLIVYPLPPKLVALLEEKHRNGGKLGIEGAKSWAELKPRLEATALNLRGLASHPKLEEKARQITEALQRLDKNLHDPDKFTEFTGDCFRYYRNLSEYVEIRRELMVTKLPAVDVLIHGVQAHLRGNLPSEGLALCESRARGAIDDLVSLYKDVSSTLDEEARQGFLKGIDCFTQAWLELKTREPKKLKDALVNLRDGATLMQHLAEWRDDFERSQALDVPEVGDFVKQMLAELRENGSINPETMDLWIDEKFWDLQEHWAVARHEFYLPRPQKDRIVTRVDSLMLNLRDLDQATYKVQEQLLISLETQYEAMGKLGFKLDSLQDHPLAWLLHLLLAVLKKGVPVFKIRETIEEFRDSLYHDYAVFMERYLADGDRDHLLDAMAQLEREYEEKKQEALTTDA